MNEAYDPSSDYLERHFAPYKIYTHDTPKDTETELKILHPPEYAAPLYEAIRRHKNIIFAPGGMYDKGNILLNVGIETFDPRDPSRTMLFDKFGLQARVRTGIWPETGEIRSNKEFNLKTKLNGRQSNAFNNASRLELEVEALSLRQAWNIMARHPRLRAMGLDLSAISPDHAYVYGIAMSARNHGEFAHLVEMPGSRTYLVKYMPSQDQTLHLTSYGTQVLAQDWESEYEARGIATFKNRALSEQEKIDVIEFSKEEIKTHLTNLYPDLWLSHRSKMGRMVKSLKKSTGMEEREAVTAWLAHRITVDEFFGEMPVSKARHDFTGNLLARARETLTNGTAIVQDLIQPAPAPLPAAP